MLVSELIPFRPSRRPRDTTAYVGMVVFLGGWAMMFGALFFAYGIVRVRQPMWPPPGEAALPIALPALNTLMLLASSLTMVLALRAAREAQPRRVAPLVGATLGLGLAFLASQLWMWRALYLGGLRPDSGIYGSVFYALTCFHGLHVLVGLIGLTTLLPRALRGKFNAHDHTPVRMWGMFWHFVDAVWVVMFVMVYVL